MAALVEEEKQEDRDDAKPAAQTDGRLELTPARRNSEEGNDRGTFVPSPQELASRAQTADVPSNPSNTSESELPVTSVSQPAAATGNAKETADPTDETDAKDASS